jgi:hypothetical protein
MNPWKVSAQFAAFVWYSNRHKDKQVTNTEAAQFAKDNWIAFLPYAHEGYGKLLIQIARPRSSRGLRKRVENAANPDTASQGRPAVAR